MFRYKNLIFVFIALLAVVVCAEVVIGTAGRLRYRVQADTKDLPPLGYIIHPDKYNLNQYVCNGSDNCQSKMRIPSGTGFKKPAVVIFGCSFAHGDTNLTQNQTFSHKLSQHTRRPVYNRAVQGKGLAFMLLQTNDKKFYETVPEADTYIYVFMYDAFRRMFSYKFDPVSPYFLFRYTYDKNKKKLVPDDYSSPVLNFLRSTYLASFYNAYETKKYIDDPKNAEEITDIALLHFLEARKNLENHYNKTVKFIVLFYSDPEPMPFQELLKEKLLKNNFIVLETNKLTDVDLFKKPVYLHENGHPTEEAWNLLTPLIIKSAQIY